MNKKDFDKLEIVKQVDYINKKITESNKTTKEICIEIGIGLSTVSERFKKHGYIFNRSLKQYVLQQLEGQESFINNNINEVKEEPADKPQESNKILDNTNIAEEVKKAAAEGEEINNTNIIQEFNKDEIKGLKELLSIDIKALNQIVKDYTTKQNTKCSIKINDTTTTVTSLRLNKELYSMVKDRAAAEKIGITDIMNKIMLDYLNK